jgi:hypothetical protein
MWWVFGIVKESAFVIGGGDRERHFWIFIMIISGLIGIVNCWGLIAIGEWGEEITWVIERILK